MKNSDSNNMRWYVEKQGTVMWLQKNLDVFHGLAAKQYPLLAKGMSYHQVIHLLVISSAEIVEIPGIQRVSKRLHAHVLFYVAHLQNNEACNDVKGLMDSLLVRPLSERIVICVV